MYVCRPCYCIAVVAAVSCLRALQFRYALADRFTRNSSIHLASANALDYRVEDHTLPVISGAVYDGRFVARWSLII